MAKEDKKYIKSYTDIDQSRKLAEILPLNSADMCYNDGELRFGYVAIGRQDYIPCWSLATLLNAIPYPVLRKTFEGWICNAHNREGTTYILGNATNNPIDTCVEMIVKLHELKKL